MPRTVVFHCPTCGFDRLGAMRRDRWSSWLRNDRQGDHVTCVGCARTYPLCTADRGPVGVSYRALLNEATRAMAASVAAVDDDLTTADALVEFVRSCSWQTDYAIQDLRVDAHDPALPERLRGDLTLLATRLEPRAGRQLTTLLRRAAAATAPVTDAAAAVLDRCEGYLAKGARVAPGLQEAPRR